MGDDVRVKQHTSLAIFSAAMTADEMADRIGLAPDEVLIRGRRRAGPPPVPRSRERLVALCRAPEFSVGLLIARHFPDEDGVTDGFGWHLDPELVEFLAAIGAAIGVDEYDYTDSD